MPRSTKTAAEKLSIVEEQIKELENQKKELLQQQKTAARKARDHRLCKRGAYLESIIPDTIPLTDEQFYQFLDKILKTERTAQILHSMKAQDSGGNAGAELPKTAQRMNGGNAAGSSDNKQEKAG
jgi:hypothetical protein